MAGEQLHSSVVLEKGCPVLTFSTSMRVQVAGAALRTGAGDLAIAPAETRAAAQTKHAWKGATLPVVPRIVRRTMLEANSALVRAAARAVAVARGGTVATKLVMAVLLGSVCVLGVLTMRSVLRGEDGTSPALAERGRDQDGTSAALAERGRDRDGTSPALPERGRDLALQSATPAASRRWDSTATEEVLARAIAVPRVQGSAPAVSFAPPAPPTVSPSAAAGHARVMILRAVTATAGGRARRPCPCSAVAPGRSLSWRDRAPGPLRPAA